METIANVGKHDDTRGKGHYEATVLDKTKSNLYRQTISPRMGKIGIMGFIDGC